MGGHVKSLDQNSLDHPVRETGKERNNRKLSVMWYLKEPGKLRGGSAGRPQRLTGGFRNHPIRGPSPGKSLRENCFSMKEKVLDVL